MPHATTEWVVLLDDASNMTIRHKPK
jgi:hypothetical protein